MVFEMVIFIFEKNMGRWSLTGICRNADSTSPFISFYGGIK